MTWARPSSYAAVGRFLPATTRGIFSCRRPLLLARPAKVSAVGRSISLDAAVTLLQPFCPLLLIIPLYRFPLPRFFPRTAAEGVPHVMLSYQWNSQDKVKRIAEALTEHGIRVWFDINGDMNGNINVAMAEVGRGWRLGCGCNKNSNGCF